MRAGRSIVREIRQSETFNALNYRQRDLFQGLIEVADDQGRMPGTAALVRSVVWPADDISLSEVQADLDVLAGGADPFIVLYQVEGKSYLQVINWWRYQRMNWASESAYPAPEGWTDRVRINMQGNKVHSINWDREGGFSQAHTQVCTQVSTQADTEPDTQVIKVNDNDNLNDKISQEEVKASAAAKNLTSPAPGEKVQNAQFAWDFAIGELQREMGKSLFDSWVAPARMIGYKDGVYRVSVINRYAADMLRSRAVPILQKSLKGNLMREVRIEVVVGEPAEINSS